MSQNDKPHAQPLVWGHGPRTFEVFLEPTCPYSVRAFNKLSALLENVGEDNVTVKNSPAIAAMAHVFRCDCALYSGGIHTARRPGSSA